MNVRIFFDFATINNINRYNIFGGKKKLYCCPYYLKEYSSSHYIRIFLLSNNSKNLLLEIGGRDAGKDLSNIE
jgi:hypothetical protein